MRPTYEVADVINAFYDEAFHIRIPLHHQRTLNALRACRTAALGGHIDACQECGFVRISYNSCRNRHCPKCQGLQKEMWIIQREEELLPVAYFHVVFTLPHSLPRTLVGVHCIVPSGGINNNGSWQNPRKGNSRFLYPILAMNQTYKAYFLKRLRQHLEQGELSLPDNFPLSRDYYAWKQRLYQKDWVVYAKPPFGGVENVVNYLARYSHRIAIANHRIINITDEEVSFRYKDYKDGARQKVMTLTGGQFLQRFCLHILPDRFRKIRHLGFLSNAAKRKGLNQAKQALINQQHQALTKVERKALASQRLFGNNQKLCPCYKKGQMVIVDILSTNKDPPG